MNTQAPRYSNDKPDTNVLTHLADMQTRHYGTSRVAVDACDTLACPRRHFTWTDIHTVTGQLAAALVRLGIDVQDAVAVFAPNCPEILFTDLAAFAIRAIPVSIYSTSSRDQVRYIVNDAGCRMIFVGNKEQYRAARRVVPDAPTLKHIVLFPGVEADEDDRESMTFESLLSLGAEASADIVREVSARTKAATPEDVATLIYTSGTTGEPKGAILPHSCFDAAFRIHRERLRMLSSADTSLCFLPLSHIFEKAWTYFCLYMGIHVTVSRDPKEIQKVIRDVRPTCMCSVPRFWEKAYMAVMEQMDRMKGLKKQMVVRALKVGRKRNLSYIRTGRRVPSLLEAEYRFYDKRIFGPIRAAIGIDRGNIFPTAGAPLAPEIVAFFHAIGVNLLIGYGLSETTATVSCYPEIGYEIGTVGTVMPRVEVRISPKGEIQVRGATVMRGYLNKPEASTEAFTADGWFRTGDAGYFDPAGALILTERIKDLFKTSNGKYIAPQLLESRLAQDRFIDQVAIIGDRRKYVTALIVPSFEALGEWARRMKLHFTDNASLVALPEVHMLLSNHIERLQEGLPSFERIKKFTLLPAPFTMESGELTNTLKVKRPVVASRYASEIEAMYR